MMLSPERLALPDYEYLGRSFGEGKKSRRIRPRCGGGGVWVDPVAVGRGGEGRGGEGGAFWVLSQQGRGRRKTALGE